MIKSMTGFGRSETITEEYKISVEMKAVNHRYCDIGIKMPKKFNAFENVVRSTVKEFAARGKIDIYISYEDYAGKKTKVDYHDTVAQGYMDAIEKAVTDKTRAIIICTPNNPTGAVYSEESLRALADLAIKHDFFIIADEIYEKLVYDGSRHFSIASISEEAFNHTCTINGFSKAYAMTGWRLGYVAARQDIIKGIMRFQSQVNSSNCSISQKAGVAALTGPQDSIAAMVEEFARRKDYVYDRVCKIPHMSCPEPKGAFYVLCDISYYFGKSYGEWHINNGHDLSEYLLVTQQVSTVPGEAYYLPGTIRFAYANSMENLKIALDRVEDALAKLQ